MSEVLRSPNYVGTEPWPKPILDKVHAFIEDAYSPQYTLEAKAAYRMKRPIAAQIFLEWHDHPSCNLTFTEDELRIIHQENERA